MKNEPLPAQAGATIAHRFDGQSGSHLKETNLTKPSEGPASSPSGQSFVTRRAIAQIVRAAVVASYGVTGLADDRLPGALLARLGLRPPAIVVRLDDGITIELRLLVGAGIPVAEVARQVESGLRYAVRRSIGREIARVTIRVAGLRADRRPLPRPLADESGPPSVGSDAA
ncbi:MAG: Asp23/Gls24 family envelope stress response protein [Candidatus Limnocylindrales bacterium]